MSSLIGKLRSPEPADEVPMQPLSVRLDASLVDRLDRVIDLAKRRGVPANRSDLIRDALDSFIGAIEEEFHEELELEVE